MTPMKDVQYAFDAWVRNYWFYPQGENKINSNYSSILIFQKLIFLFKNILPVSTRFLFHKHAWIDLTVIKIEKTIWNNMFVQKENRESISLKFCFMFKMFHLYKYSPCCLGILITIFAMFLI